MDNPTVSILHISDAQFGDYHRFGQGADSLASRLISSLRKLPKEVPRPDLVIFSGDAAETGMGKEFAMAADFLMALLDELSLPAERLVIVPGNHDVNWKACQGYIFSEEAEGRTPESPYAPKWDAYQRFLEAIYGAGEEPPLDGVWRFPELGVMIAGLNSTIEETHEVHRGFCGEEQLLHHAEELRERPHDIRVAVVHHNVRKNAVDRENLEDDEDFVRLIGPHVDLVLHGHTHNGKRDYLSDSTVVLSTGSTALTKDWRPEEVPNQFQILALTRSTVRRWAYAYVPGKKEWLPDPNVGTIERVGYEVIDLDRGAGALAPALALSGPTATTLASPGDPLARLAEEEQQISEAALDAFRRDVRDEAADLRNPALAKMEILDRLGLLSGGRLTRGATLLFGDHPQRELPSAIVQCVQYHGSDRTAPRESRQILGTAMEQVDGALGFLRERIERRERPSASSGRSDITYEYPMTCVREVLVNAIVHRDYGDDARCVHVRLFDDRIEIANPGDWFGLSEGEDVELRSRASESVRRNPRLASAMSLVRYFEGEGSGVPTAVSDSEALWATEPRVRVRDGFVSVSIYPSRLDPDLINHLFQDAARPSTSGFNLSPKLAMSVQLNVARQDDPAVLLSGDAIMDTLGTHTFIVGAAGTGKTTLLRQIAMRLAESRSAIPVSIAVRELVGTLEHASDMVTLVARHLHLRDDSATLQAVEGMLSAADVVLLVDGLDELLDRAARRSLMEILDRGIQRWPRVRVIATSRADDFADLPPNQTVFKLQPWSQRDIQEYLQVAGAEIGLSVDQLLELLRRDTSLQQLATSPLMLNMLFQIYAARGTLPDRRIDLYDEAIDLLLSSWDTARSIRPRRAPSSGVERLWLQALALRALEEGRRFAEMPLDWCVATLTDELEVNAQEAREYFDDIIARPRLLTATAGGALCFLHLTYAEYLAAEGLVSLRPPARLSELVTNAMEMSSWRRVAEFAVAISVRTQGRSEWFTELLRSTNNAEALDARITGLETLIVGLDDAGSPPDERTAINEAIVQFTAELAGTPDSSRVERLVELMEGARTGEVTST